MEDLDMSPAPSASKIAALSTEVIIVAIIVLCFVIAFFFCLHLYTKCFWMHNNEDPHIVSWRRRMARGRPQSTAAANRRRGLDSTALQSLPVVVYNPKDFKDGLECAVCLSEVTEGEKARLLPKCNHGFHVQCIDMWFQSHSTCPLCRNSVISDDHNNNNGDNSISIEVQEDDEFYTTSDSSDSDNDHDPDHNDGSPRSVELPVYPTNVLFWGNGNETQARSFGQSENGAASSSGATRTREHDEMVIDIPVRGHDEFFEDCLSQPSPQEQAKTPVVTRLQSLKRLLSLGRRGAVVVPSPRGSSSCEVNQDQQAA